MATANILDLLKITTEYFAGKGIGSPRLDAEVLLAFVMGVDRVGLYLQFDRPLAEAEVARYRECVRRRAGGEPCAYILGKKEFWSLPFSVGPAVLIPRPETELLVEEALKIKGDGLQVAELGVGSGAVVISILSEKPGWRGVGVDISEEALKIALLNARQNNVGERLQLICGDLFGPLSGRSFDLIISNPPYIPTADIAGLAAEVGRHEPKLALDGGPDGLGVIRRIISRAPDHLKPGGRLMMEFGLGQEGEICRIMEVCGGYAEVEILNDLTGRPRAVAARVTGAGGN